MAVRNDARDTIPSERAWSESWLKAPRVLIVDDDPWIRELCSTCLEIDGFVVLEAPDGSRGLELVRAEQPDLVVTDVRMPGLDGFQLADALRRDRRTRGIPIVFLSAETDAADRARAYELGAAAYVAKPFDPSMLCSVIAGVLEPFSPSGIEE